MALKQNALKYLQDVYNNFFFFFAKDFNPDTSSCRNANMLVSQSAVPRYVRGLLGGGGGMSSVSGSEWCLWVCPGDAAVHLSMNSKRISFVTGWHILLQTAENKKTCESYLAKFVTFPNLTVKTSPRASCKL